MLLFVSYDSYDKNWQLINIIILFCDMRLQKFCLFLAIQAVLQLSDVIF